MWKKTSKKKTRLIVLIILFISIGFAYLSKNLDIIGSAFIKANKWDIHFANVEKNVISSQDGTITLSEKDTKLNFEVNLEVPGDFFEFNVDVVNGGTIAAELQNVVKSSFEGNQEKCFEYTVKYSDGSPIEIDDDLLAEESKTLTVRIEYKKDITEEDLIAEETQLNLSLSLTYVQKSLNYITLSSKSGAAYTGGSMLTIPILGEEYGTLSCNSSEPQKAQCSIANDNLIITTGDTFGKAKITVSGTTSKNSEIYSIDVIKPAYTEKISKLYNIEKPSQNNSTQQSVAYDGNNYYVLYPSDSGETGVIQKYVNGVLSETHTGFTLDHASNTSYYNGFLYVLGLKTKSQNLKIYKINTETWEEETIYLSMSKNMIWDGLYIYDNKIHVIGYDKNGNIDRDGNPTESRIDIININSLEYENTINASLGNHTYYTCQGFAVLGDYAYALTSPASSTGTFQTGINIDRISLKDGSNNVLSIDAANFQEPEGAYIYTKSGEYYLVSSLVNRGGIYTLANIGTLNGIELALGLTEATTITNGSEISLNITGENYGELSCNSNNESVATCQIIDKNLVLTPQSTAGAATITLTEDKINKMVNFKLKVVPKYEFSYSKTLDSAGTDTGKIGNVIDYSPNRAVTEDFYYGKAGDTITLLNEQWKINVYLFDFNGNYKQKTAFIPNTSTPYKLPYNCLYRIIIKKSSEGDFTPDDPFSNNVIYTKAS